MVHLLSIFDTAKLKWEKDILCRQITDIITPITDIKKRRNNSGWKVLFLLKTIYSYEKNVLNLETSLVAFAVWDGKRFIRWLVL